MQILGKPDCKEWSELGNGQRRKICAYNDQLMSVQVNFDDGAVGADHSHPHTQLSYVLEGEFTYHIEDAVYTLHPGDSIVVEGGKIHGCTCIKAGTLLDVFTPMREDFVR
jgi:quercetin dioxygenase-like cupin family protein